MAIPTVVLQSEGVMSARPSCLSTVVEATPTYRQQLAARGKMTIAASVAITEIASTKEGTSASSHVSDLDEYVSVQHVPAAGRLYHQQLYIRGQALLERIGGLPALIQTSIPTTAPTSSAQTPATTWLKQATLELHNEWSTTNDVAKQWAEDDIARDVESDDEVFFDGLKVSKDF